MNNECKKALGELTYEAPRVDVLEVMVERGYYGSSINEMEEDYAPNEVQ
jgi:hypothetical protein